MSLLRLRNGVCVATAFAVLTAQPALAQNVEGGPSMMGPLIFQLVVLSILAVIGLVILLVPAFIAFQRQHPNRWAIAVICLAFGGTIIGWFGALVWAFQAVHRSPTGNHGGESGLNLFANDPVIVSTAPTKPASNDEATGDIIARLSRLDQLRAQGHIDDTEHLNLRRVILSKI